MGTARPLDQLERNDDAPPTQSSPVMRTAMIAVVTTPARDPARAADVRAPERDPRSTPWSVLTGPTPASASTDATDTGCASLTAGITVGLSGHTQIAESIHAITRMAVAASSL